ncbi:MAG: NADH-quinone oxidoreductase subunit N, partial [bacterium]
MPNWLYQKTTPFLSKEKNYPNYYNATCYIIVLILSNQIVIDIWNRFDIYFSYDLSKNMGDIYFKFFLIFLSIIYLIYSNFYVNKMHFNDFEYLILLFFIILSFNYFIIVTDIISFYLLLEIQSFGFYLLTALNKKNQYSIESGLKYFVLSSFSSIILLFGFSFLYGITGTLNINDFYLFFLNVIWNDYSVVIYIFNILLVTLAIFFKLYVAPFHIWISDIYQGAPTSSTAFFATITSFPLFYFFSKFYLIFFSIMEFYLYYFIFISVILSMLIGSFSALYQKKIKRLVAFSSVGSIGYILIGFLEENPILLSNAFNYFIIYIINIISIFIVFLNLYLKKSNFFLERFSMLSNFITKNKLFGLIIVCFFFTASGMPPFSLFFAKILL